MPLLDNINEVAFYSNYPIDKIVASGTVLDGTSVSIVNPGAQAYTNGTTLSNYPIRRVVTTTISNPYGRAGMVRYRWSVDGGTTWQGSEASLLATATFTGSYTIVRTRERYVSVACSDSQITLRTYSELSTGGTVSLVGMLSTFSGWTATSTTFLIEYWLYERD